MSFPEQERHSWYRLDIVRLFLQNEIVLQSTRIWKETLCSRARFVSHVTWSWDITTTLIFVLHYNITAIVTPPKHHFPQLDLMESALLPKKSLIHETCYMNCWQPSLDNVPVVALFFIFCFVFSLEGWACDKQFIPFEVLNPTCILTELFKPWSFGTRIVIIHNIQSVSHQRLFEGNFQTSMWPCQYQGYWFEEQTQNIWATRLSPFSHTGP